MSKTNKAIKEFNKSQKLIRYLKGLKASDFVDNSLIDILDIFISDEGLRSKSPRISNNTIISPDQIDYKHIIEITLNSIHTPREYSLIPLNNENRKYFPGYKVDFILETDVGIKNVHVTSGEKGNRIGDSTAGNYIVGGLQDWYKRHNNLTDGSKLKIEIIERDKRYRLISE